MARKPNGRSIGQGLLFVVIVAFGGLVLLNSQRIGDWFRVYGYHPTAAVSQLAADDTFTPNAKHLYAINRPVIVAKASFSGYCSSNQERTIVLGCYHSVQNGIYVLRIANDSRLNGVEQVTAAHEMLHAAYDRLSSKDRQQVNSWLEDYYRTSLADSRIKQTIDAYKKSEPNDVVNEMHSIFGTEVTKLPPQLENYYSRYFTDRSQVAGFAAQYQAEFTSREQQVAAYDAQLTALKKTIDSNEQALNDQASALQSGAERLNQLRASGDATTYNQQVPVYNRGVDTYNALLVTNKSLITQYNQLVETRNKVSLEQAQLANELKGDSVSTYSKQE